MGIIKKPILVKIYDQILSRYYKHQHITYKLKLMMINLCHHNSLYQMEASLILYAAQAERSVQNNVQNSSVQYYHCFRNKQVTTQYLT